MGAGVSGVNIDLEKRESVKGSQDSYKQLPLVCNDLLPECRLLKIWLIRPGGAELPDLRLWLAVFDFVMLLLVFSPGKS